MTQRTLTTRHTGLTLIETVVAVGLLSSVGALFVPTLSKAREDAKRLTCQSRLGQTGRALLTYRADLGALPLFTQMDSNGNTTGWAPWSYGGWSGRNREFWEDYAGGIFNIQGNRRPLSVYMTPWPITEQVDDLTPTQDLPVFRCPADRISYEWQFGDNDPVSGLSAYDDVGTSYQFNWSWWQQTDPANADVQIPEGVDEWSYRATVLGAAIFNKYIDAQPARFITILEDPGYYGLVAGVFQSPGIQTMGYHGAFSTHVAAFADGHVEYLYMDTRHLHDSLPNPPGPRHGFYSPAGCWTVCDETREHPSGARHDFGAGGMQCER